MPPPHPRLPPLPQSSKWTTHSPSRLLPLSPDRNTIRKSLGRTLLANPALADRFVCSLPIRQGEVVLEGYAGVGGVTRSLLNGGREVAEAKEWAQNREKRKGEGKIGASSGSSKKSKAKQVFPNWLDDLSSSTSDSAERQGESSSSAAAINTTTSSSDPQLQLRPRLVVASEGSIALLEKGFDYPESASTHAQPLESTPSSIPTSTSSAPYDRPKTIVIPSAHDPNLLLSHSTVYTWPTLSDILANELVAPHLPIYDPVAEGGETTKRPWEADEPPITLVCQVPDSSIGEQLVAQWIGSAVGDPGQQRTWIWEWGRVRLALLAGRSLYDRIMAEPGEIIHCKLSILAQALFDITPIPPLHDVRNVDKQSKITVDRPIKRVDPLTEYKETISAALSADDGKLAERERQKTITFHDDFYPSPPLSQIQTKPNAAPTTPKNKNDPLIRPVLLGLVMTPKKTSPILASQKDAWDYVMRRLFVRDTLRLKDGIANLSFGAEGLLDRIESDSAESGFRGKAVTRERIVRELDVDEWARIVDVFDQWAFKPDNLILDSSSTEEFHRELGQD